MAKHFVFDVSSHGFGHFAQSAAVINAVSDRVAQGRFTVRSKVPESLARQRICTSFDLISHATDFGMLMNNTLDVDEEKSFSAYDELHAQLDEEIARETQVLDALSPDFLFSNVSYVSIAAAKRLGIPVVGLCSLNWADIFIGYYATDRAKEIYQQMLDCYNFADCFICPTPSMAMPGFKNIVNVSPISLLGESRRTQIENQYPKAKDKTWVLVSPGGIPTTIDLEVWPERDDLFYVIAWQCEPRREDMVCLYDLSLPYIDILASCDVVLTKPGYGTVSEAMCNRVPMLYARRKDWPEERFLVDWLQQFGRVSEVPREVLFNGRLGGDLDALLASQWTGTQPQATGAVEAANIIAELVS